MRPQPKACNSPTRATGAGGPEADRGLRTGQRRPADSTRARPSCRYAWHGMAMGRAAFSPRALSHRPDACRPGAAFPRVPTSSYWPGRPRCVHSLVDANIDRQVLVFRCFFPVVAAWDGYWMLLVGCTIKFALALDLTVQL